MRLLCPNCQQAIMVPETEAGKDIACSHCAHSFAAPQLYSPPPFAFESPVAPSSPPTPAPIPPGSTTAVPSSNGPSVPPEPAADPKAVARLGPALPEGLVKFESIAMSPEVCEWLTPVCLTIVFVLSFFRWVGFFPAGYPAYTQNPWQAMFGDMSVDPVAERVFSKEKLINEGLRAAWWLIPYFVLLVFGMLVAWLGPVLRRLQGKPAAPLEFLLRYRPALLTACAGLALFLLLIQAIVGFGLENALRGKIPERLMIEREQAKTPEDYQKLYMQIATDSEEARLPMRSTFVLRLAILLHVLALAGVIGETVLIHRGPKPPPRVGVMW